MIAEAVSSIAVVILLTVIGVVLLYRLRNHYVPEDERIVNGVDCPKCGGRTHAFERECRHCGYNRWEGGGNDSP